jgi:hypothetical protein
MDDKTLKPVDWIDVYSNDTNKNELKSFLDKAF